MAERTGESFPGLPGLAVLPFGACSHLVVCVSLGAASLAAGLLVGGGLLNALAQAASDCLPLHTSGRSSASASACTRASAQPETAARTCDKTQTLPGQRWTHEVRNVAEDELLLMFYITCQVRDQTRQDSFAAHMRHHKLELIIVRAPWLHAWAPTRRSAPPARRPTA